MSFDEILDLTAEFRRNPRSQDEFRRNPQSHSWVSTQSSISQLSFDAILHLIAEFRRSSRSRISHLRYLYKEWIDLIIYLVCRSDSACNFLPCRPCTNTGGQPSSPSQGLRRCPKPCTPPSSTLGNPVRRGYPSRSRGSAAGFALAPRCTGLYGGG